MWLGRVYRRGRFLSRAESLAAAGDFHRALVVYDEGLSALRNDGHLLLHRALVQARAGRTSEAKGTLLEAMRISPSSPVYPLFLGRIYHDSGEAEEALSTFQSASDLDPSNDLIQTYLGLAAMTLGRVEEGHGGLAKRVCTVNAACQGRVLLYCEAYLVKHWDVSRPLERLVSEADKEAQSRRLLARAGDAVERGLIRVWHGAAEMLAALRYSTDSATRQARRFFLEGSLRYDLEEYDAAWVAFSRSLELEPGRALTGLRLADLCLQRGNYAGALSRLAGGQEERGEWQSAVLEIRGLAMFHEGRYVEALDQLSALVRMRPREYLYPYYVGLCHLRLGDAESARTWFEKAAGRLNPCIARLRLEEMMRVRRLVSDE